MSHILQKIKTFLFICTILKMFACSTGTLFEDDATTPVTALFNGSGEGSGDGEMTEVTTMGMSSLSSDTLYSSTFILAFPSKPKSLAGYSPYLTVTNLAATSVSVEITFIADNYIASSVIRENDQETFELPTSAFLANSNGITNKTIIVCSSGDVAIYGFVSESEDDASMFSADQVLDLDPWDQYIQGAYQALSANNLGTEYYVVSYPKQQDYTSVFTVSAVENDTSVNITFSSESTPRAPRKFTIQFGETYQVLVTSDTTFSTILSDKPVSVIAGSKSETNSVFMLKQIPPSTSFGNEFVLSPFNGNSYDFCIIASDSTKVTVCEISGATSDGSNATDECSSEEYQIEEFMCVQNATSSTYQKISSQDPVLVFQYIKGYTQSTDFVPLAMFIVPSIESFTNKVEFSFIGHGNVFMNIFIISNGNSSFEINGDVQDLSLFLKVQIDDLMVYRLDLSRAGKHIISSTSDTNITVFVQGGKYSDTQGEVTTMVPTTTMGSEFQSSGEGTERNEVESSETMDVVNTRYDSLFAYTAGPFFSNAGNYEVFCIAPSFDILTTSRTEPSSSHTTTTEASKSPTSITPTITIQSSETPHTQNPATTGGLGSSSETPQTQNVVISLNNTDYFHDFSDVQNVIEQIINGATINSDKLSVESASIVGESTISLSENTVQVTISTNVAVEAVIVVFKEFDKSNAVFEGKPANAIQLVTNPLSIDLFDGGNEITELDKPITMVNTVDKPTLPSSARVNIVPLCSWWDPVQVHWTDEGCSVTGVSGTQIECECNHLTIFGVLMELEEYPETSVDTKALEVLTIIGLVMSISSLVVTLGIFAYSRLRSCRILIHTNLCIALLFAHILFVFGIEVGENHESGCTALAFFMHYLFMATFCWMMVEGLYLLVKTRPQTFNQNIHIAVWSFLGWGIPLFIVGISMAVEFDGYGYPTYKYEGDNLVKKYRCWLDVNTGLIWAFIGPACCILLVNLIILIGATRVFCTMKLDQGQTEILKSSSRLVIMLSFILGPPWIFGLLDLSKYTVAFSYIFVLGNAFQGVFILVGACLLDKEVMRRIHGNKIEPTDAVLDTVPEKSTPANRRSVTAWSEAWKDDTEHEKDTSSSPPLPAVSP